VLSLLTNLIYDWPSGNWWPQPSGLASDVIGRHLAVEQNDHVAAGTPAV